MRGLAFLVLALWPVFLWSVVQEDVVRLFELDDVLTLPVELVDPAAEPRWPQEIGVETTVRLTADERGRPWATTSSGLSVLTHLDRPAASSVSMRAALSVPIETTALLSFVTGTVHRIEIASVTRPGERWALSETPVAPVRFRRGGRHRVVPRDEGILVHLDLLPPRCRCREIAELQGNEASRYARRHLRATAEIIRPRPRATCAPSSGCAGSGTDGSANATPAILLAFPMSRCS